MANDGKNIVICLDGTGNQIQENLSNVLKLYRTLEKNDKQIVFYDQGVGTLKKTFTWGRWKQRIQYVLGLAFGYGLDRNVLQAYEFLVNHYTETTVNGKKIWDEIYIFGFSRGAHTARVLAGLIYEIGILRPEQVHLSSSALMAYKQSTANADDYEGSGMNFQRVANTRRASVKFLGVFDTVSSVFVPNPSGYFPPLVVEKLPHTLENPCVQNFRHAMAIDERRRMFRADRWKPGQFFKPIRHLKGEPEPQNANETWFSGFHSDVGGGHNRADSGLSQIPLIWMLQEAKKCGLKVFDRMADYVTGIKPYTADTTYLYPEPSVEAATHNSMSRIWNILEYIPKSVRYQEWSDRRSVFGYYLPRSEPRFIDSEADVDQSVYDRIKQVPGYSPENLNKPQFRES